MNNIKDALSQFLRAGIRADEIRQLYKEVGLNSKPLFEVFSFIHDGLCILTGEEEKDYGDTSVYLALMGTGLSEDERVQMLMRSYMKNKSLELFDEKLVGEFTQPNPHIISRDEMRKQAEHGCGYMAPEGDWT